MDGKTAQALKNILIIFLIAILIAGVIALHQENQRLAQEKSEYRKLYFRTHLQAQVELYQKQQKTSEAEAIDILNFIKQVTENQDGYKTMYDNGKPKKELNICSLFKYGMRNSEFAIDSQVNNGRGPVDFTVSKGTDKTIVEVKLGSSKTLEKNLKNQVPIYEAANNFCKSVVAIICFSEKHINRVVQILNKLHLQDNKNVVVINASVKKSASIA